MEHYGIRGTALIWYALYLFERQQYVSVNGNTSDPTQEPIAILIRTLHT